jgi:hypothetical protein
VIHAYAGIGSRDITPEETERIKAIARRMARDKFILYSGNAEGADMAFQQGSNAQCILMLPWMTFNAELYSSGCIERFDLGDSVDGSASVDKFHPSPSHLTVGGRRLMARNYHQIMGYRNWPRVEGVIYCAGEDRDGVKGGTGQAVRIAKHYGIETINIRYDRSIG